jgi:hypothetical protein
MATPVKAKPVVIAVSQLGACAQALADVCRRTVAKGQVQCWDESGLQIMLNQVNTKAKEAGLEVRQ